MRKSHEAHLAEKQQLVKNLEDFIEEQEAKIMQLEMTLKGQSSIWLTGPSGSNCFSMWLNSLAVA